MYSNENPPKIRHVKAGNPSTFIQKSIKLFVQTLKTLRPVSHGTFIATTLKKKR